MQQALEAEKGCKIPKEHAREEEEDEVRRSLEVDCVGKPGSSISSPSQWFPHSTSSSIVSWPFISSIMRSSSSSWSALRSSELSPCKQPRSEQ